MRRWENWMLSCMTFAVLLCPTASEAQQQKAYAQWCRFVGNGSYQSLYCSQVLKTEQPPPLPPSWFWTDRAGLYAGVAPGDDNFLVDVVGTGRPAFCRTSRAQGTLHCATREEFGFYDGAFTAKVDIGHGEFPRFMVDVNGDGKADFCRLVGGEGQEFLSCAFSDGKTFGQYDFNSAKLDLGHAEFPRFMADVNGDGKADFCRLVGGEGQEFLSCALSDGKTLGPQYQFKSAVNMDLGHAEFPRFMADVNGDKKADFCRLVGDQGQEFLSCTLSDGTTFGAPYGFNAPKSLDLGNGKYPRYLVDVNGDGKADFCGFVQDQRNGADHSKFLLECRLSDGQTFNMNQPVSSPIGQLNAVETPQFIAPIIPPQ